MGVSSMTGFSRVDGNSGNVSWYWEVRSVNARGLDVRIRLAPGVDALEAQVRQAAQKSFKRGNVSLNLHMLRSGSDIEVVLNEDVLQSVLKAARRVEALANCQPVSVESLFGIKGVLELREKEEAGETVDALNRDILAGLEEALEGVIKARQGEGQQLENAVRGYIGEIERLTRQIDGADTRKVESIKARLKEQVAKLLETGQELEPSRLHQEAVVLVTRSDIEEELKRLHAHVVAARGLLNGDGPVGRKLDFLAQEFNREANTVCAKSNDVDITEAGLALKVVVDQMREQVQNIE